MPAMLAGKTAATCSCTRRSPASPTIVDPACQWYFAATRALMNAPCPFTSIHGSGAFDPVAASPGVANVPLEPGTGRNRSTPSTRKISPEKTSP